MESQTNNHNQLAYHKKKNVFVEEKQQAGQLTFDSDYDSGFNITNCTSTTGSLNEVTTTPSRTDHDSLLDSAKLTPVTQNINRISNFHITTPKSIDHISWQKPQNHINKTSLKRSSSYFTDNTHCTPKKTKQHKCPGELSDRRALSGKYAKRNFRQKLHSAPDLDIYFDENQFSPAKQMTSLMQRTPLLNSNITNFQSFSSTPYPSVLNNNDKLNTIQNLTDCSNDEFMNILKNHNSVHDKKTLNEKVSAVNAQIPFQRALLFPKEFDSHISSDTSATCDNIIKCRKNLDNKLQYKNLSTVLIDRTQAKKRAHAVRNDADHEKSDEKSSTIEEKSLDESYSLSSPEPLRNLTHESLYGNDIGEIMSSSKLETNSNEMQMLPKLLKFKTESDVCDSISMNLHFNWIPTTPPRRRKIHDDQEFNKSQLQKYQAISLPTTPKKLKTTSQIIPEKFDILYPTIPTTPCKKLCSPKRKQQIAHNLHKKSQHRRQCYDGAIHLNIIAKLEPYTVVLDRIFEYLSDRDLLNLSMVTKVYRKIIKENLIANRRLKSCLKKFQACKENVPVKRDEVKIKKKLIHESCHEIKKLPFALQNNVDTSNADNVIRSPVVSPSKRKFSEHQKIVKILIDNQRVTDCPRCNKASRIFEKSTEISMKTYSIITDELNAQKSHANESRMDFQPYAECMTTGCKFVFCLECNCEYHPGSKCKLAPKSPTKEDIENGITDIRYSPLKSCKTNKKRRRKALKRLCF